MVLSLRFYAFSSVFLRCFLFHEMFGRQNVAYVRAGYGKDCLNKGPRKILPSVRFADDVFEYTYCAKFDSVNVSGGFTAVALYSIFGRKIAPIGTRVGHSETVTFLGISNVYVSGV